MKKKPIYLTIALLLGMALLFSQALAYAPRVVSSKGIIQDAPDSTQEIEEVEPPENTEAPEMDNDQDNQPGQGNQSNHGNSGKGNRHPGKKTNFKGTVKSFNGSQLILTDKNGVDVTITMDENTSIKITGPKANASAQIQEGQWVIARTVKNTDGSNLAIQVHVLSGKPQRIHRVGKVTAYAPGTSITVLDKHGGSSTFDITTDTKILPAERTKSLKVGSRVTIICPRDPVNDTLTAIGIVIHPEKGGNQ